MIVPGSLFPEGRRLRSSTFPWKTTLLCVAATVPGAMAQSLLAPPPAAPPLVPPAVEEYQTNQASQMQAFSPTPPSQGDNQPFKCGPVVFRPQLSYQLTAGSGIESGPGSSQNTIVQQLSPGMIFDIGSHWTLGYTPTLSFYSSSQFRNTVDHSVLLQWGTAFHDWFVTASQSYAKTSEPQLQTAAQTDQQAYITALNATYQFNDRLSAAIGLNQNLNYFGQGSTNLLLGLSNSRAWSTMDWLYDQFWSRFNAGIGVGVGYNQQAGSPDSWYQQYEASVSWRITDKISFQVNGGLEDMEYLNSGANDLLTPIFGATLQYQPFDQTKFSVSATRTVASSYYDNEAIEATSVNADFNQRLFGGVSLDLNGGFTTSSYVATIKIIGIGLSTARNDDTYSFNARLSCPFPKRGTVAIFYQYSNNSSTQTGFAAFGNSAFSYSSSQYGFDISYNY